MITRRHKHAPPDQWDLDRFPLFCLAGDNKFGATSCPTCGKQPTKVPMPIDIEDNDSPAVFLFRNEISVREYHISGMCQACQDKVFGAD